MKKLATTVVLSLFFAVIGLVALMDQPAQAQGRQQDLFCSHRRWAEQPQMAVDDSGAEGSTRKLWSI